MKMTLTGISLTDRCTNVWAVTTCLATCQTSRGTWRFATMFRSWAFLALRTFLKWKWVIFHVCVSLSICSLVLFITMQGWHVTFWCDHYASNFGCCLYVHYYHCFFSPFGSACCCYSRSLFYDSVKLLLKKIRRVMACILLTHLAPDQPLPFRYEIPCKGK